MITPPTSHPTLMLIRGLPGSGKSHLSATLRGVLGNSNVVELDPDATDYQSEAYLKMSETLTNEGVDAKFHPYRFLRAQAYAGIEANKIIMWNQGFTNLDGFTKTIINLQTYATEHGTHLPLLVVEVEIHPDTAKNRVANRASGGGHDVPEEMFKRFINDYRSFTSEGFNTVTVQGEDDVQSSAATVGKALEDLWIQPN